MLDTNFSKKLMCVCVYIYIYIYMSLWDAQEMQEKKKKPDAFPYPALDIETSFFPQPFF